MAETRTVRDAAELAAALHDGAAVIEVSGTITGSPGITLPAGVTLRGGSLVFGAKGVRLTRDNTLEGIEITVPEHELAIYADTREETWGTLTLTGVTTVGQVSLVALDAVRSGHVRIEGLTVKAADVRGRADRPRGFGVEALQGALTVWNRQPDPEAVITAEITGVSAGSAETPVRGSGVFVGGHGTEDGKASGGELRVSTLSTGEIVTDGGIPEGTPDLISGGVFVISGAVVDQVVNEGPVTTHGPNDMVLDNWGRVTTWTCLAPITSRGPSGIGFVNFSDIETLDVRARLETFGRGARGFNLYDGSLAQATFDSITTHGDGSIGVQLSRPMGALTIAHDLSTEGGEGLSLVKGVQVTLKAAALSIKPGGSLERLDVGGDIRTAGDNVVTVELAQSVGSWRVGGGIHATGAGSDGVHLIDGATIPDSIPVSVADGTASVVVPAG
jgi:hypothetical protein